MSMLDEILAKREELYAIARRHQAEKLWVFGSVARREERPDSDVDFLVRFLNAARFGDQVRLADDLRGYLGMETDVVSAQGLSPYIAPYIERERIAV